VSVAGDEEPSAAQFDRRAMEGTPAGVDGDRDCGVAEDPIAEALHIRSAAAARGLRTSARGRRCLVRGPRPGQHVPPAIDALHRQDVTGMAGGERPGTTAPTAPAVAHDDRLLLLVDARACR
jgi:hypothetical protein